MVVSIHTGSKATYEQMSGCVLTVDWQTRRDLHNILFHTIPDYSSLREKIRTIDATPIKKGALFLNEPERAELEELLCEMNLQCTRALSVFKQSVEAAAHGQMACSSPPPANDDPARFGYLMTIDPVTKCILRSKLLPTMAVNSSLQKKIQDIVANDDQKDRLILNKFERAELLKLLTPHDGQCPEELQPLKESLQLASLKPLTLVDKVPLSLTLPSDAELEESYARFEIDQRHWREEQKQIRHDNFPADRFFKLPVAPLDGSHFCMLDGRVLEGRKRAWHYAPHLSWRWEIQGRRKEIIER